MIFTGDIASPLQETTDSLASSLSSLNGLFEGKRIICNFEGLISEDARLDSTEPVLYNHPSILKALDTGTKPLLCLANNHVLDLPGKFGQTSDLLKREQIPWCGAGNSFREAEDYVFINEGTHRVAVFNACWDFLMYNQKNPSGGVYVSEIKEEDLLKRIKELKGTSPETVIAVFLHWNFDLEILPFPSHRIFARELIDAGVSVVVGSHSHCVQGGEKYRDGYIVYGLGNFYIPQNHFVGGRLTYPEFASTELALEWNPETNKATCHWFRYEQYGSDPALIYEGSEKFEESDRLKEFSPFAGMSDEDYLRYFIRNRRKRHLIPVFRDYRQKRLNRIYTMFLKSRARIARTLARLRIIKWQN